MLFKSFFFFFKEVAWLLQDGGNQEGKIRLCKKDKKRMERIFLNEQIQVYQEGIKYPISAGTLKKT